MNADKVLIEETDAYEIGRINGALVAACRCGGGLSVVDKGLGRAWVAAWKTQHQTCATP